MAKQPDGPFRSTPAGRKKIPRKSSKDKGHLFWGVHPVIEALKKSPANIEEILLEKKPGTRTAEIIALAEKRKINIRYDKAFFREGVVFEGERHQGVAARIAFPYVDLSGLLAGMAKEDHTPFILARNSRYSLTRISG